MTTNTIAKSQGPVMQFARFIVQSFGVESIWEFGKKVVAEQSNLRKTLRLLSEVAIIPTVVILFYQLSDVAKSDEVTTYNYITHYETGFLHKEPWRNLSDLSNEITSEIESDPNGKFRNLATLEEQDRNRFFEEYDKRFIDRIKNDEDLKASLDQFAAHFRAVLYCVEEGRCDAEIARKYYASPMCDLRQQALGYIEEQYADYNWDKNRGNLLDFYEEYDCKTHTTKVVWGDV